MGRLKNKTKKQNVLVMSVLGLTLLIVSLLLTYSGAYLTEKVGSEVSVTSGKYSLELDNEALTELESMKPGDSREFTIEYKNTGNIPGDLHVEISAKTLGLNEFTNEVSIYHNEELVVNSPNKEGIITIKDVDAGEIKSINIRIKLSPTGSDQLRLSQSLEVNVNANLKSDSGVWTSNVIKTKTSVMYGGYSNSLYTYSKNDNGTYTVTGFDTIYIDNYLNRVQPRGITIPSKYKDKNVTAVGTEAFKGKGLTSVVFSGPMITIGNSSFAQNQLKTLTIPNNVTQIGTSAFQGNSLTSIKLSNKLTQISDSTLRGNQLTTINIPASVTKIETNAFISNPLATAVIAPNSKLKTIENRAFFETGLKSINLPDGITNIGPYAFGNNDLTSINLGTSLITIGTAAFGNNKLQTVSIPSTLKDITKEVFINNKITEVNFEEGLGTIGEDSFANNLIDEVVIPETTTMIQSRAFKENQIKQLTLPDSVTVIKVNAFTAQTGPYVDFRVVTANLKPADNQGPPPLLRGYQFNSEWKMVGKDKPLAVNDNKMFLYHTDSVTNITRVEGLHTKYITDTYGETPKNIVIPTESPTGKKVTLIAQGNGFAGKGFESIIIPEGIKEIGGYAFESNLLKEIIIPSSVTKIGQGSFRDNKLLIYVEIPDSVTSIGLNAFTTEWEASPTRRFVRANLLSGDLIGPPPTLRGYTANVGWILQPLTGTFSRQSITDELEDEVILEDDVAPEVEVTPDDSTEETPKVDTDVIPEEETEDETVPKEETEVIPETEPPKTPEESLDLENDDETLDDDVEISVDKKTEVNLKTEALDTEEPIDYEPSDIPEVKDK